MPSTRCRRSDEGFTLVEVLMAITLFVLVTTISAGLLITGLRTTRENADRVAAANIARWQLDYWRSIPVNSIPLGLTEGMPTAANLANVLNPAFTVRTEANWVSIGQTKNSCDTGVTPGQDYKRVTVTVQSVNLGEPVQMDTVIFADTRGAATNTAPVVIKIVDQKGLAVSDVKVTAVDSAHATNNFVKYTGADGCLYVPGLTPDAAETFAVTVDRDGFRPKEAGKDTLTARLQTAVLTRLDFSYAAEAGLTFSAGDVDFPLPAALPVTYQVNDTGDTAVPTTASSIISGLWPTTAGADVWATCDGTHMTVRLVAGQTIGAVLPTAHLRVRGLPPNTPVTATCAGDTFALGRTSALGLLDVGLPYGTWSFTADGVTKTPVVLAAPPADKPDQLTRVTYSTGVLVAPINGTVIGSDGLPLEAALITATDGTRTIEAVTDAEGSYSIGLRDGSWSMTATDLLTDQTTAPADVDVTGGVADRQTVDFSLVAS